MFACGVELCANLMIWGSLINVICWRGNRNAPKRPAKANTIDYEETRIAKYEKKRFSYFTYFDFPGWLVELFLLAALLPDWKLLFLILSQIFLRKQQTKVASYNDSYRYSVLTEGNLFFISWFAWYVRRYVGLCCSMFLLAGFGNFVFANSYARNKIKYTHISCMQFNCINRDKNIT